MSKCITIYTDASLCLRTGASAWACWIKYGDGLKIEAGNKFKENCTDSTHAELKAIANALTIVKKNLKPSGKILVVVTDSQIAINLIEKGRFITKVKGKRKEQKAKGRAAQVEVMKMIKKLIPKDCELRMKKVKAHSTHDGKRSYVNNRVDEIAKSYMHKRRSELAIKGSKK